LKSVEGSLDGHLKKAADYKTNLTTADTAFNTLNALKQEADRVEKDAWRVGVKAMLEDNERAERELTAMIEYKQESYDAEQGQQAK